MTGLLLFLAPIGRMFKRLLAWLLEHPSVAVIAALAAVVAFHHIVLDPRLRSQRDVWRNEANEAQFALGEERAAHRLTKQRYRAAQDEAAALEQARLARVTAEQREITDEVTAQYRVRLADAHARAERLRSELGRAGEPAAGAPGGERVPGTVQSPGGADGAAAHSRLPADQLERDIIATEQAIQLDELITLIERQSAVRVNTPEQASPALPEAAR